MISDLMNCIYPICAFELVTFYYLDLPIRYKICCLFFQLPVLTIDVHLFFRVIMYHQEDMHLYLAFNAKNKHRVFL